MTTPGDPCTVPLTRDRLIRIYPRLADAANRDRQAAASNFARVHPFRQNMVYVALRSDGSALAK